MYPFRIFLPFFRVRSVRNFPIRLERSSSFPFFLVASAICRPNNGGGMACRGRKKRTLFCSPRIFAVFKGERESSESVHFSGQRHLVHFFCSVSPLFYRRLICGLGVGLSSLSPPPLYCQYNVSTCKWVLPPYRKSRRATSDPFGINCKTRCGKRRGVASQGPDMGNYTLLTALQRDRLGTDESKQKICL